MLLEGGGARRRIGDAHQVHPLPSVLPAWDLADAEELFDARVLPALDSWDFDGFAMCIPSFRPTADAARSRLSVCSDIGPDPAPIQPWLRVLLRMTSAGQE